MPTLTFLGTGTSTGIPMLGCSCKTCSSKNSYDKRLRSSVLLQDGNTNVIVDTTPEFRLQCLSAKVKHVDAVIITHDHADHVAGFDDLRSFNMHTKKPITVYCSEFTAPYLKHRFNYVFDGKPRPSFLPLIDLQIIREPLKINKLCFNPLLVYHGSAPVTALRIANLAYLTDVSRIPEETKKQLQNLDILIIDAVRFEPHPTHFSVKEALDVIAELQPKQAYLTHLNHNINHQDCSKNLPENVALAYDGLQLMF